MFHLHEMPVSLSGFIWLGVNTLCVGFPKVAENKCFPIVRHADSWCIYETFKFCLIIF